MSCHVPFFTSLALSIQYNCPALATEAFRKYKRLLDAVLAVCRNPGSCAVKFPVLANALSKPVDAPQTMIGLTCPPALLYPFERVRRSSVPTFNACLPRFQLKVSA